VERIDEDLDLHAKKKKPLRLADAQFLAGQTPDLPKLQLQLRELRLNEIELETGRPRTDAYRKPARLDTGLEIMVPLFIFPGEKIRVDTIGRKYAGRESEGKK
jgi:Elongation factor P, C-terminal